jgi:hypothetical protein
MLVADVVASVIATSKNTYTLKFFNVLVSMAISCRTDTTLAESASSQGASDDEE